MAQKLDSFSKILIATAQINYMSANLDAVNDQMKMAGLSKAKFHKEGIDERDRLLSDVVVRLADIMEDLGNNMTNTDCLSAIDVRVTTPAFEIIVHGKDDVEKDYQNEED